MKIVEKISLSIVILLIVSIISTFGLSVFFIKPVQAQSTNTKRILVLSGGNDSKFKESISIDSSNFEVAYLTNTDSFISIDPQTDVLIVFDALLETIKFNIINSFLTTGGSLIVFMGPNLHENPTLLNNLSISSSTSFEKNTESNVFIVSDDTNPISSSIDWNSAPNLKPQTMTIIGNLNPNAKRIVDVYPTSRNLEIYAYRKPVLIEMQHGNGNILLFSGWLEDNQNLDFTLWPYFNYMLYSMIYESLDEEFQSYPLWPFSPVPHMFEQTVIGVFILCLGILVILLFLIVKKRSKGALDQATIYALKKQAELEELKRIEESKELEKKIEEHVDLKNDWEVIGIHRQLGGFFFTFFIGLILVIPQLLISNFLMPQIIQPFPSAAGWYYLTYNFFQIAWLLFDFGTSYALAKFFSQYRVKNPEKAIHYVQIFVWWQLFTGLAQITFFGFLGSLIFPYTNLAHMSWIFITFSFVQYPGFFLVFMYTFQGMQRSDLQLVLYVCWEVAFLLIGQMIFCYIGRLWGAANPIIGEALGAGIGYSIARYFDYWMTFIVSVLMFKKLGFSPMTCFRIDFSKDEFKEVMLYGSKLAFGESFVQIGYFLQIIITSLFIANYSNELGYFQLTWNLGMIVQIVTLYGQSLLGAFSESSSHNKKTLTKLYVYQALRWGNYFGFFLVSVLMAVGAKFLVGAAGPEYGGPAVKFLIPLLLFHTFGIYSWLVDAVFQGTGNPMYAALVWIIEQTTRAILMLILVLILNDMVAVLLAYIPAVLTKDIIAWIIVKRKIIDYKVYSYKTFVTPAIASIINFIVIFFVGELLWMIPMGDKIVNTALLFVLGTFIFLYFYAFVDGFLGGYDSNTLKELEKSANMIGGSLGKLPKVLYKSASFGAKLSPFHNKFKIDIYEEAMEEAYNLTLEKKILKI